MNKLIEKISEHSIEYGSLPFWSWNDKLSIDHLKKQIHDMKALDMKGFFMHARLGLETEYMSDEWFDCIRACVSEAKELGMEAWSYDENGYPSGSADGKVPQNPEYRAVFLSASLSENFPEITENTLAVYSRDENNVPHLVDKPDPLCKDYLTVCLGRSSSYVDLMRADVTDEFIKQTYAEYKKRLGDDFGVSMPGFFTDEPQCYRPETSYSLKMPEWLESEYGYSIFDALPALFTNYEGAEIYRYDYMNMLCRKFTTNFSKRLYDWADENKIMLTGHYIAENSLEGQVFCGDIMAQYRYEHIPGVDFLGRTPKDLVIGKQLGSVCAQTGRKKAIAELFAGCGWDVTPSELRLVAEAQYSGGVNLLCQHLYPYSIRGERKRDYPAFYSEHSPWQSDLCDFNRYFKRLGYMLSMGNELAETLVLHPVRSAWLSFIKKPLEETEKSTLNAEFNTLLDRLGGAGITFHLGSESIMEELASVSDGKIKVGMCEYGRVVIPACDTLTKNTARLLREFISSGGRVYTFRHHLPTRIDGRPDDTSFLSGLEDISDAETFEKFRKEQPIRTNFASFGQKSIRMMVRNTDFGRLIYVANLTDRDLDSVCMEIDSCQSLGKINISTLELSAINGRSENGVANIVFNLDAGESTVLCEYGAPKFLPYGQKAQRKESITEKLDFKIDSIPENMMTLDRAQVSLDGGEFSDIRPIERIRDELLSSRFEGKLVLRFPFDVRDIPKTLKILTEPFGKDCLTVNGKRVRLGSESMLDSSFSLTDISAYCVEGENYVDMETDYFQSDKVYDVLFNKNTTSSRNCLVFDTEIESIYLIGSFALDMKKEDFIKGEKNTFIYPADKRMTLVAQRKTLDITNIVTDGYPFYSGELSVKSDLFYRKGDPTVLKLTGRFATAHIKVNGKDAGKLLFSSRLDLEEYLVEGENEIRVTLRRGLRNLLGPFHAEDPEPSLTSPKTFSFEKAWKNGSAPGFCDRYSFIRYGIDV